LTSPPALDVARLMDTWGDVESRPALTFYRGKNLDGRTTYGELRTRVLSLANVLRESGLEPGDRVAILSPNRFEIPVIVLALLRLGAVVVPLNPSSSPSDWAFVLKHSRARALFATGELLGQVTAESRPDLVWPVEPSLDGLDPSPRPPPVPDDLADRLGVVLYTSGTTGDPKGVGLRQRNAFSNAWSMAVNFSLERSTQLAVLPLYHAHAFGFGLMTALTTAGHLVFTERLEPFTWAHVISAESVTVTSVVPTMLPMLLAAGVTQKKVPTLRHILVSSAPVSVDAARDFEKKTSIPLMVGWGLSEYTNFACCMPPGATPEAHALLLGSEAVPSIGPALVGTEVRVLAPNGDLAAEGEPGELLVRGHSTMQGYLDDPAATARTLDSDGFIHTGDEGLFRLHEGRPVFFVTGRIKEIIIRDAEKYSPLALERRVLLSVPELAGKLVILGFPHEAHGEEVGAYVEDAVLDAELRARLESAVAAMPLAERPKVVLYGSRLIPRTHTGKIQRRKMQEWFAPWARHRGGVVFSDQSP
jgi:long-chain acyl-CoA synthetase